MILPIVAYGDPVLRKVGEDVTKDHPGLDELIKNMFETMYASGGVGIAAPQVGKAINLFLVDTKGFVGDEDDEEDDEDEFTPEQRKELENFLRVFINAEIIEEKGEEWAFNEGCLS